MLADQNVIGLKHLVLYHVAKLAFEGRLEEERDNIPYEIIPGPKPLSRCCIYKEREIIRQRVRLAEGKAPGRKDDGNMVQVISSACEDCPISSYTVTDNCQNCAGKACINACRFGAISKGEKHSKIDAMKCKECGMCAKACPYNAIAHLVRPCKNACPVDAITYDENGLSVINEEKCIRCGHCVHRCPFGAIGTRSYIVDVIEHIKAGDKVFAMVAPAAEGQFGHDITMGSWRNALKDVGFTDMIEVAMGADFTTKSEADEWFEANEKGESKTTSCCPAFVNLIRKHYPELADNISTTVSPMCMTSRYIKACDPEAYTVFIGPCIAKKSEVALQKIEGNADAVLTFSDVRAMMRAKNVNLLPDTEKYQEGSVYGKRYGNAGGVTASVLRYLEETGRSLGDSAVYKANGVLDCKKALVLMKMGRLPEKFIEGMVCEGGCVGGPSVHCGEAESKRSRDTLIGQADDRTISDNVQFYSHVDFELHR
ncbi:MAG: 4Fe-4S dicluster domain-containing protein [Eubacteriales bacterium]|nr:4Fe-4S dicluster domain-containing protein [Eubacteriales bacterium]